MACAKDLDGSYPRPWGNKPDPYCLRCHGSKPAFCESCVIALCDDAELAAGYVTARVRVYRQPSWSVLIAVLSAFATGLALGYGVW